MDTALLKKLGNIDQVAGVSEKTETCGRGEHIKTARVYNAAGLDFTVAADLGMNIYEMRYKGMNLAFHSKNGMTSPQAFSAANGEFAEQWPGGFMVTCGLDNVGGHSSVGGINPTHGRIGYVPASNFGTESYWDGERYVLRVTGEVHETKMYGRHLSIRRSIETELQSKTIRLHDVITNFEPADEPYMLLYHTNFGYPLLDTDTKVRVNAKETIPMNEMSTDPVNMMAPIDGRGEELYLHTQMGSEGLGMIWNDRLGLGVMIRFATTNLPNMMEWKNMRSHDYVLALEPCNTFSINRDQALEEGKISVLPAYSSVENEIEITILDGAQEIAEALKKLDKQSDKM